MKLKYTIILFFFLFLVGVGIGLKMFFKPHTDVSKSKAEFKMKASVLMDEFQKDEDAATLKYSEKVLEINGKLITKNKLSNGTELLILENEMEGISCQLDSNWSAANQPVIKSLETGNPVTLKGVCKGYLMEIKVSPAVVVTK